MQRSTTRPETKWPSSRFVLPTPQSKLLGALSVLLGVAIVATIVLVWAAQAVNLNTLVNNSQVPPRSAPAVSDADRNAALASFERNTRNLAESNSPDAFPTLLQSLKQDQPLSQRILVLAALKDASPAVVPALITALNDDNAGVREGAVQVLGMRREQGAIAALSEATRDPSASVRLQAVLALSAMDVYRVLPRLEQLAVNEPNDDVRNAALAAKASFKQEIARAIGIPTPELRDISVTTGNLVQIYAVTTSHLYALHGTAWTLISPLPDTPIAIASGADPALIYLATASSGLYRSFDEGETWEYIQFGLQTLTKLTVTAIVVDPQNSHQAYIALASEGAEPGSKNSLGISESRDGGATWWAMENSPTSFITTRLVIDPQARGYLFGMTLDTPWRYTLPVLFCDSCVN